MIAILHLFLAETFFSTLETWEIGAQTINIAEKMNHQLFSVFTANSCKRNNFLKHAKFLNKNQSNK